MLLQSQLLSRLPRVVVTSVTVNGSAVMDAPIYVWLMMIAAGLVTISEGLMTTSAVNMTDFVILTAEVVIMPADIAIRHGSASWFDGRIVP